MAEHIIVSDFKTESEAYQLLSELRQAPVNPSFIISQACIVKNEYGHIVLKDQFDTGIETTDDTKRGGLIGSLAGILGGPVGMLLGGGFGALIGSAVDSSDTAMNASMIEKVCDLIPEGTTSLIALISETVPLSADAFFLKYDVAMARFDAAEVAVEIEQAEELQRQMEKEARQKMREDKKEAKKQKIEEKRAKMKADFENFKAKFKK